MVGCHKLRQTIQFELKSRNCNSLIIIDDAGRLGRDLLQIYQYLRDTYIGNTGIILAGTEEFLLNFLKWKRERVNGIPELASRINRWVIPKNFDRMHGVNPNLIFTKLNRPTVHEMQLLCQHNGIGDQKIVKRLIKGYQNFRELESIMSNYKQQKMIEV